MARPSNQSAQWNFTVAQLPMRHPVTNAVIPNLFGNFREDTGACLGTTSEQYGLIQNPVLMETAVAALEARGLTGYKLRLLSAGDGRRFFAEFTFANKQIASQVGDLFGYKLILKNSFDRTLRAAFSLGFLRLACTNGMATLEKEFAVTQKHSTKVNVDFIGKAIDEAMARSTKALGIYDAMAQVAITDVQGINILRQLEQAKALSGVIRQPIETLWLAPRREEDKARNLYNLYNAVTEHLTHQVENDRFEYSSSVNQDVLFRLVNAARKPEQLAKLVIPVPNAGVQAQVVIDPAPIMAAQGPQGDVIIDVESTVAPA